MVSSCRGLLIKTLSNPSVVECLLGKAIEEQKYKNNPPLYYVKHPQGKKLLGLKTNPSPWLMWCSVNKEYLGLHLSLRKR